MKLGLYTNKLALCCNVLEDLAKEGTGTNEVEVKAWIRSANRKIEKGRCRSTLDKGRYKTKFRIDMRYIGNGMKIRIEQAKEDWSEIRS